MSDDNKIRTGLWKKDGQNGGPPYYGGKIEIGGQEFWVNLYKNDRKTEDTHPDLNLVLKPKESRGGGSTPRNAGPQRLARGQPQQQSSEFDDDGIPFVTRRGIF